MRPSRVTSFALATVVVAAAGGCSASDKPPVAADRWDKFVGDWIAPLGTIAAPVLGGILVLLVIARLRNRLLPPLGPLPQRARRTAAWLGVLLAVAALILAVASVAWPSPARRWTVAAAMLAFGTMIAWAAANASSRRQAGPLRRYTVVSVVTAVVGTGVVAFCLLADALWAARPTALLTGVAATLLFAWGAGANLEMRVEVHKDDKPHQAASSKVAAYLRRLGSEPPRGLSIAREPDVTGLPEGAVAELPEGRIAAVILGLLRVLVPTAPWHAVVHIVGDNRATVSITRNYRQVADVEIDRRDLMLPRAADDADALNDLCCATAAVLLLTLVDHYPELRRGLCGARRWESIACQVLAAEVPLAADGGTTTKVLAHAVSVDPENLLAHYALAEQSANYADITADSEKEHAARLSGIEESIPDDDRGYEALRLRLLYTRASSLHNADLLGDAAAGQEAKDVMTALIERIGEYEKRDADKLAEFIKKVKPPAKYLCHVIIDAPQIPEDVTRWSPDLTSSDARYQYACYLAEKTTEDVEVVLDQLKIPFGDDGNRVWARQDPSFSRFACDPQFKQVVGDSPPERLVDFPAFAQHASRLMLLGATTPAKIIWYTGRWRRRRFAEAIGAQLPLLARWRGIAAMCIAIQTSENHGTSAGPALSVDARARLQLLMNAGIGARTEIPAAGPERDLLLTELAKLARASVVVPPTEAQLVAWRDD